MDQTSIHRFQVVVDQMPRIAEAVNGFDDPALRERAFYSLLGVLDPEEVSEVERERAHLGDQIDRLAAFILDYIPDEPSMGAGAVDTAITLLGRMISRDWYVPRDEHDKALANLRRTAESASADVGELRVNRGGIRWPTSETPAPGAGTPPAARGLSRGTLESVVAGELLTADEHHAVKLVAEAYDLICSIEREGPGSVHDLAEVAHYVHALQRTILTQAAARAHPDLYRLLGGALPVYPAPQETTVSETGGV